MIPTVLCDWTDDHIQAKSMGIYSLNNYLSIHYCNLGIVECHGQLIAMKISVYSGALNKQ